MALGSAIVPAEVRGSGLALLRTVTSLARLVASIAFGALWTLAGFETAIVCFVRRTRRGRSRSAALVARPGPGARR